MSASTAIKKRLEDLGITQIELASRLGITRQNLNNKLARDNFSAQELQEICKALEMTLLLIGNDKKEYIVKCD